MLSAKEDLQPDAAAKPVKDITIEEEESHEDTEARNDAEIIQSLIDRIHYSDRYNDDTYAYRHVILPREYYRDYVPKQYKGRLLTEAEWRYIGIMQSPGWHHYELHLPEPHIFLFRRAAQS